MGKIDKLEFQQCTKIHVYSYLNHSTDHIAYWQVQYLVISIRNTIYRGALNWWHEYGKNLYFSTNHLHLNW